MSLPSSYETLSGERFDLSEWDSSARNTVFNLNRFLEPDQFSAHTIAALGKVIRNKIDHTVLSYTADELSPYSAETSSIAVIQDDIWQRLLQSAHLEESDVQPDRNPSWAHGLFIDQVTHPADGPENDFHFFGTLFDGNRLEDSWEPLQREHAAHGRTLRGYYTVSEPLHTALIRYADHEYDDVRDILAQTFGRAFQNKFELAQRTSSDTGVVMIACDPEDAISQELSAPFRMRYGNCFQDLVDAQRSFGGYWGWRAATRRK